MHTIGVFDSGVGGLSVLREIRRQLPNADLLYFADTAHVPYGSRPPDEVRQFALAIADFLLAQHAQALVIACNTASAAALSMLRARLSGPIIGMEPAVKPAVERTRSRVVAVLATQATLHSASYNASVKRHASEVEVIPRPCPGLVEQIEAGELSTATTEAMLRGWIEPLLGRGIDELVLGCTHYPFVRPLIEQICGPSVHIIDPAAAVARQTARIVQPLPTAGQKAPGTTHYFCSGPAAAFEWALQQLGAEPGPVHAMGWRDGNVVPAPTVESPAQAAR